MLARLSPFGRKVFYGWWLLAAGTLIMVIQGSLYAYGFSAFFIPLAKTLKTSRGTLSLAFSFTRLESGLLGPAEGFFIDRFGPRGIMLVGFVLFGLAYLLFSQIDSIFRFYLIFPLIALGASMSGFLPVVTAVNNWFDRRRGLATGISSAGVNLGGVLVGFVAQAIDIFGWRTTAVGVSVLLWVMGLPLTLMMRHRPQDYGYRPDGNLSNNGNPKAGSGMEMDSGTVLGVTAKQALGTSAFWVIAICHAFSVLIIGAVTVHEIPLLVDAGLSFQLAAWTLSFMTGVALVGRIAGGYIGDLFGKKPALITCFILMSAGVLVLATATTLREALIFAVLYGVGYGARAPLLIALRGDYFGPKNFGAILGLSQPVMMIGSFLGPVVAGYAYDVQGSYQMVFTIIAVVNLVGAGFVLLIKKPSFSS